MLARDEQSTNIYLVSYVKKRNKKSIKVRRNFSYLLIAFLIDDHFLFCFERVGNEIKLEVQLCSEQREQFPEKLSSSRKENFFNFAVFVKTSAKFLLFQ